MKRAASAAARSKSRDCGAHARNKGGFAQDCLCDIRALVEASKGTTYRPTVSESPITHKCLFGRVMATVHRIRLLAIDQSNGGCGRITIKTPLLSQKPNLVFRVTAHQTDNHSLLLPALKPVHTT